MKKIKTIIFIIIVISLTACTNNNNEIIKELNDANIKVAVSIVPEAAFVRAVAGEDIIVTTMIPPGQSEENFAPSPKLMKELSDAQIYFSIGVPTEQANIFNKLDDFNSELKIVELNKEVAEVYEEITLESGGTDPHIWLSPKRVIVMIETIKDELTIIDPENKDKYETNAKEYIKELEEVNVEIENSLKNLENKTIIVYHPAFGYFAQDFGLKMIALEEEGKEATPEDFRRVIDYAKENNIKVIFYQAEVDSKQSDTFATEIGGKSIQVEPLSGDYIENLKKMAELFSEVSDN
ncbi:metal ABC transporter solute-binding protein, Zn/Mn family [Clostridium grantii]|uniref:Zinc transport system substrate-binding protein n=1 Tax=Clostridium grantii DSM 8605 TaxID=1121316 RepID=A0A1M5X8L6_9CLOT|nr:zinc ABC transporter substrate-binding protein [Clostridium grantii]SHH96175.1 zinc transport system substrate-binding protein [Clostridium grantii DSM 8605]